MLPTMPSGPVTGRRSWDLTAIPTTTMSRAPKVTTVGMMTDRDTFRNGASVFTSKRAPNTIEAIPPRLRRP